MKTSEAAAVNLEGKMTLNIHGGQFTHRNDLYVQVCMDGEKIWRTVEKDGYSPTWNSSTVKFLKGEYTKMTFILMDEDTFSRDDVIGQGELLMTQVCQEAIDKIQVFSEKGKSVGTIDVTIEYAPQEVDVYDLMESITDKGP